MWPITTEIDGHPGRESIQVGKTIKNMSPKIQAISQSAPENLAQLLKECSKAIEESFESASIEASVQDKPAKVKLTFAITLDLDTNAAKYHLGWSVAYGKTIE